MTVLVSILFVFSSLISSDQGLTEVRKKYFKAGANPEKFTDFENYVSEERVKGNWILTGYRGVMLTMKADRVVNPVSKLSAFNEGKGLLEQSITAQPNEFELIFLRFSVQSESPSFLKYKGNINADKSYLLSHFSQLEKYKDPFFADNVRAYLRNSKQLTESEKKSIPR